MAGMPSLFSTGSLGWWNTTAYEKGSLMSTIDFRGRDLLGIEDLTADEIRYILDAVPPFKEISERDIKKVPTLLGKTLINLFFEPSTRTRTSFEIAGKRLSADVI